METLLPVLAPPKAQGQRPAGRGRRGELRYYLHGATWEHYKQLQHLVETQGGGRVSFLDGTIELMSLSLEHESRKSLVGGPLELYLDELDIPWFHHGSATLEKEDKQAGQEPDESYCFHTQKNHPDLAIEVAISRSALNTLEIYRRFGVRELWLWQRNELRVFVLTEDGACYESRKASMHFPELDLRLLESCARIEDAHAARKAFRNALEGMGQ